MKPEIELLMLKLADGARVIRLSEQTSGLRLEKRLDPDKPVVEQTDRWKHTFLSLLERETGASS